MSAEDLRELARPLLVCQLMEVRLHSVSVSAHAREGDNATAFRSGDMNVRAGVMDDSALVCGLEVEFGLVGQPSGEDHVSFRIEYHALFSTPEDLDPTPAQMSAYATLVGAPALWPYVRALTDDIGCRMGIGGVALPVMRPDDFAEVARGA